MVFIHKGNSFDDEVAIIVSSSFISCLKLLALQNIRLALLVSLMGSTIFMEFQKEQI